MIDNQTLEMLVSEDVEERKRAVTQLAKTRSREALKVLAEVYRDDESQEVRDLARKGGLYIRKFLEDGAAAGAVATAAPPARPAPRPAVQPAQSALAQNNDDLEDIDPFPKRKSRPVTVEVSREAEKRAKELTKSALDYHMRGDNERAAQQLRKALQTNPSLVQDSYTASLAATITGLEGTEAVESLAPDDEMLRQIARRGKGNTTGQALMAYVVLMSAVLALAGYFMFPWIDLARIPIPVDETLAGEFAEVDTLGEGLSAIRDVLNDPGMQTLIASGMAQAATAQSGVPLDQAQIETLIDTINSLRLGFSGLDTTMVLTDLRSVIDVIGLRPLVDGFLIPLTASIGVDAEETRTTLYESTRINDSANFVLFLIPASAAASLLIGFFLLRHATVGLWVGAIVIGLLGIGPLAYFYVRTLDQINALLNTAADAAQAATTIAPQVGVSDLPAFQLPTADQLIGLGFWVTLGGMLVVALLPFIAMIFMPAPTNQE
ncbi:MAG: HEAT repeat domain-containing protein [bacterium]|nr:HEAT repeat domain-containing protein [bacterium]